MVNRSNKKKKEPRPVPRNREQIQQNILNPRDRLELARARQTDTEKAIILGKDWIR